LVCVTQSHPIILRNSLIFIFRYVVAQKSDKVRTIFFLFDTFRSSNQAIEKDSYFATKGTIKPSARFFIPNSYGWTNFSWKGSLTSLVEIMGPDKRIIH